MTKVPEGTQIPEGYKISAHENRGYDSPDRWFEAHLGGLKLGEFGTRHEAIEACVLHKEKNATSEIKLKIKRVSVLYYEDGSPDKLSLFIDGGSTFPGSGYHPALDTQCGHGFAVKWLKHHFPTLDEKLIEIVTVANYRTKFSRGDDK